MLINTKQIYKTRFFNFRTGLVVMLILTYLIISIFMIRNYSKQNIPLTFTINVKNNMENTYKVYYDDGNEGYPFNENDSINVVISASSDFQTIAFRLPTSSIKRIRIDFGHGPNEVIVKDITLQSYSRKYKFEVKEIRETFFKTNDIHQMKIENDQLYIHTIGKDPFIYSEDISHIFRYLSLDKTVLYLKLIITAVFLVIEYLAVLFLANIIIEKKLSVRDLITVGLFLIILFMPIISNLLGTGKATDNVEKRSYTEKPIFTFKDSRWVDFPKQYETYFSDNFGLRDNLIKWNNRMKIALFNVSPVEKVLIGKDKWLFYSSKNDGDTIADYKGTNLFTIDELNKITTNLKEQKKWLEGQGIEFYILVAPNKHTIYPEYLPDSLKKAKKETRVDQLIEHIHKNSDVKIIDVRQSLNEKKKIGRLYHKSDTHWNDLGAFIAYQELSNEISKDFPQVTPKEIDEFNLNYIMQDGGDLANMLYLKDKIKEENMTLAPNFEYLAKNIDYNKKIGNRAVIVKETANLELPKAVFFRDSFCINMIPFLSEHFMRSIYIWDHKFNLDIIEDEQPDIVVHEIVERYLDQLLIDNPKEIIQ